MTNKKPEEQKTVAVQAPPAPAPPAPIPVQERGIAIRSTEDLMRISKMVIASGLAPEGMNRPEQVCIAIQTGLEVGLQPMQALRSIAVINNRPSWYGKAGLGLIQSQQLFEKPPTKRYFGKEYDDDFRCEVTMWRRGAREPQVFTFSVADAKLAKLWNKKTRSGADTPWVTFPKRMMYWRCVAQGLDEMFSDVLMGLTISEVAQDTPAGGGFSTARDVTPRPEEPPEGAPPDPVLEHFSKQVAEGSEASDVSESLGEPSQEELDEIERSEAEAAAAEAGAEAADELEEPEPCDHEWVMEGDPTDEEPSGEYCAKCGEVRGQGELGI